MAWSGLGQAYELVGDRENAIEAYRNFVELRPNLPEAERLRRRIRFLGGR
jgi:regulator of sirC expression with transglutaminase-like and TPR domain